MRPYGASGELTDPYTPAEMPACPNCGRESTEGFQFCPYCAAPLVQPPAGREERKLVTILFADVTGSTALGERLDPERLRSLLNTYFSTMSAVIESWGGTVEKFIGDAIMAAFGIPLVREDDPERALRASLDMLARLEDLNVEFERRHGVTLRIRIGVNTGEVIAPVGGPPEQLIVAGDAVNVAARLEQAAEPGTVLVGERTYLATRDAFLFEEPVALELKGKAEAVPTRRLVASRSEAVRGVPGLRAPMVGRDRELNTLAGLFEEAVETGRPRLVIVYGPAGIGKSRLVQEFVRIVPSRHDRAAVLRGRCPAAGKGITYWALGEILRSACGIGLDDPAELARTKLRTTAEQVLGALELRGPEVDQTIFALATAAGIPLPDNPLDRLEPRAVADELARAWPRFVGAFTARGPAVFVVEDLHWAEDQLVDMLERLLARAEGPLFLLATARPEFAETHPDFAAGREDSSSVSLRPLTEEQSGELVEELLLVADLPAELRQEMLAKAEGNPFFLEELIRRLIDEGALVREGDRWRATEAARSTILPDTIHGLLAARIDALPGEEKRVLQEAAVVGRVFWEEPVALSLGNGEVSGALLRLERKGLVFARPTSTIAGQVEFMFKHALVRDVAYASLPKTRRARAHAEHAAWMEKLAGDRLEEFAELVAHHYATAAIGEDADLAWADEPAAREAVRTKAFEALVLAGRVARKRFAMTKAVEVHEQALVLAPSASDRARALEELGDDHVAVYHGDEALASYRQALTIIRSGGGADGDRARICLKAGRMAAEKSGAFRVQPDPAEVESLAREGLEAATDEEARAWLLSLVGACAMYWRMMARHDPVPLEERIDATREALDIAQRIQLADLETFAARELSELYFVAGSFQQAVEISRQQLSVVDRVESPQERALVFFEVANTVMDLAGEYEEGLELARRSYELATDRSPHELMHATFTLLYGNYHQGRWEEVPSLLDEHLAAFRHEADVSCYAVRSGPIIGSLVLAHRGDPDRAREVAAAVPIAGGTPRFEGLSARLMVATGDPAAGGEIAERLRAAGDLWRAPDAIVAGVEALVELSDWKGLVEFLSQTRSLGAVSATLEPTRDRAEGLMKAAAGETEQADRTLRRALEGFERLKVPFEIARTQEALASVSPPADAARLLHRALETYERLEARPHAERARNRMTGGAA
jgi:class 3 adenylate cyclase/tetratricopeptide (TPR) repeat protein